MGAYRDEHEEAIERHESMRDREYLDEQRRDRAAERAPLPDVIAFTPQTLGARHREALANIDRGLDRAEELADECERRVERMLPRERPLPDPPTDPVLLGALDFLAKTKAELGES